MKQKWNQKRRENATGAGSWVVLVWTKCGGKQDCRGAGGFQPHMHSALILNLTTAQCTDT